ncbi:MAG: MBL fold metallo-hydrolase [Campylobacteraceae bacterium]|jgi:glyoxylase-like metal-dependent hydrolase (beta-lactamase superfamily II)|nr:MBL fold metallo-hydrolase [Campylobacteraceae bacterium]
MKRVFLLLIACCFAYAQIGDNVKSYKLGEAEFIALKDKDTNMGKSILLEPDAKIVKDVMPDNQNPSSINAFILKTKNKVILIDTGLGSNGELLQNLKSANTKPENIDIVLLTHMHGDHIGGLVGSKNEKIFSKAIVYAADKELEYWLSDLPANKANSDLAKTAKNVYGDNFKTFVWNDNITPEIKALEAAGHTPGHTAFEITSKNEKILVIGDLIHSLKVQTADPNMSVAFDIDPKQAADTRIKIFNQAAKENTKIAGMHLPFSGVGYMSKDANGSYKFTASDK